MREEDGGEQKGIAVEQIKSEVSDSGRGGMKVIWLVGYGTKGCRHSWRNHQQTAGPASTALVSPRSADGFHQAAAVAKVGSHQLWECHHCSAMSHALGCTAPPGPQHPCCTGDALNPEVIECN